MSDEILPDMRFFLKIDQLKKEGRMPHFFSPWFCEMVRAISYGFTPRKFSSFGQKGQKKTPDDLREIVPFRLDFEFPPPSVYFGSGSKRA